MLTASLAEDREEGRRQGLVDRVAHSDLAQVHDPAPCSDFERLNREEELPDTQVQRCPLQEAE